MEDSPIRISINMKICYIYIYVIFFLRYKMSYVYLKKYINLHMSNYNILQIAFASILCYDKNMNNVIQFNWLYMTIIIKCKMRLFK